MSWKRLVWDIKRVFGMGPQRRRVRDPIEPMSPEKRAELDEYLRELQKKRAEELQWQIEVGSTRISPEDIGNLGDAFRRRDEDADRLRAEKQNEALEEAEAEADRQREERIEAARHIIRGIQVRIVKAACRPAEQIVELSPEEIEASQRFELEETEILDPEDDRHEVWLEFLSWCDQVGLEAKVEENATTYDTFVTVVPKPPASTADSLSSTQAATGTVQAFPASR